jgi:hypothetical protein
MGTTFKQRGAAIQLAEIPIKSHGREQRVRRCAVQFDAYLPAGHSPQQPRPPLYTRLLIKIHQLLRAWIAVVSPRPLTLDQNAISGRTSKTLSSALSDIHTMREIGDHYHLRFVNIPRSGSSLS